MPIGVHRPSAARLAALLTELRYQPLTYGEVGATKEVELPSGYRHDRETRVVGHGATAWRSAQDALRTWQGHGHAGAEMTPDQPPLDTDTVAIATVRIGPVVVVAPCRIVYTTADPDRFGFAYGTLPGHPERGEEAFHVLRSTDGTVSFEIVAFSRPAALLAKLGTPVSRAIQTHSTGRYLEGVRRYVAAAPMT